MSMSIGTETGHVDPEFVRLCKSMSIGTEKKKNLRTSQDQLKKISVILRMGFLPLLGKLSGPLNFHIEVHLQATDFGKGASSAEEPKYSTDGSHKPL